MILLKAAHSQRAAVAAILHFQLRCDGQIQPVPSCTGGIPTLMRHEEAPREPVVSNLTER